MDKFNAIHSVLAKYIAPGKSVPDPPATLKKAYSPVQCSTACPLLANLADLVPEPLTGLASPSHMEAYGQVGVSCTAVLVVDGFPSCSRRNAWFFVYSTMA